MILLHYLRQSSQNLLKYGNIQFNFRDTIYSGISGMDWIIIVLYCSLSLPILFAIVTLIVMVCGVGHDNEKIDTVEDWCWVITLDSFIMGTLISIGIRIYLLVTNQTITI